MKVTFCTLDWPNHVGGVNVWLLRLLPELRRLGIESRVLFFTDHGSPEICPTVMALRNQGFDCPAVSTPVYMEDRVSWLLRRLKEDPPDVFVPNLITPAFYAGRWVREVGIPTVGVSHSDDSWSRARQSEFVLGKDNNRISALVCVSEFLEKEVLEQRPESVLIRRIPYGVPVPQQVVQAPDGKKLRLVYVGRLKEEQKRISDLTHALCRAVREVPDTEAVIYGDGPDASVVKEILANEGKGQPISLAGRVESDQIQVYLLESHVLVLLSDYEGLPISLVEAMACGVVPVCLNIRSGIPELVEHGITGLLVNDRGDDFVNAIRRLRCEPGLWQRLSHAARTKVAQGYSNEVCADHWVDLFHELVGQSRTKRDVQIPRRMVLPPVHPDLAQGDVRKPPLLLLVSRGAWRFAMRTIRRIQTKATPRKNKSNLA